MQYNESIAILLLFIFSLSTLTSANHDCAKKKKIPDGFLTQITRNQKWNGNKEAYTNVVANLACLNEKVEAEVNATEIDSEVDSESNVADDSEFVRMLSPKKAKNGNRKKNKKGRARRIMEANAEVSEYLFDIDIVLLPEQLEAMVQADGPMARKKRKIYSGISSTSWRMPIRYKFANRFSNAGKTAVRSAVKLWQDNTCMEFREVSGRQTGDYLEFFGGSGCWSYVGPIGGDQSISIGRGCEFTEIVAHEIGHALGYWHEQSRDDRDDFVSIRFSNIPRNGQGNFALERNTNNEGACYDFGSVMHYSDTAFSRNGAKTIIAKDPLYQDTMDSPTLSFIDYLQFNRLYCDSTCGSGSATCVNGGYPDPKACSKCKCPSGFGGNTCNQVQASSTGSCGGELTATNAEKTLSISVSRNGNCNWLIKAPANSKIQMRMTSNNADCDNFNSIDFRCGTNYVEIKTGQTCLQNSPDFQRTGYRLCDCTSVSSTNMISQSNLAAVIAVAEDSFTAQLKYKIVSDDGGNLGLTPESGTGNSCSTWGSWNAWSRCCGGCPRQRTRSCNNGCTCSGSSKQEQNCCTRRNCSPCSGSTSCCSGYNLVSSWWSMTCRRNRRG